MNPFKRVQKKVTKSYLKKLHIFVITNFNIINPDEFVLGDGMFNKQCHYNAVQKVKEEKAKKVIMCVSIEKDVIVHFINQLDNGKYQDNTLGWMYKNNEYYYIKEIDPKEYGYIVTLMTLWKDQHFKMFTNPLTRWMIKDRGNI